MGVFLDLAGSLFIRGSMVTVMMTLTVTLNDALYTTTQYANAKGYLSVVADTVMYNDVVHAGYNNSVGHTDYTDHNFCFADSQQFRFHGDIDNDVNHVVERIHYYAVWDSLTRFFKLYRDDGTPQELGRRFTTVRFRYYNAKGKITTDRFQIKAVQVTLAEKIERVSLVESLQGLSGRSMTATKDFRIYPSSLE